MSAVPIANGGLGRWWRGDTRALGVLVLAWVGFVLAVYCPDIGRGFVKDDFTWIRSAQTASSTPATLILPRDVGFYRPVVTATFLVDYAIHGWRPRGYGWTNIALYAACSVAIGALAMTLGLTPWSAALASFVWSADPHGIGMAVVWLSGRTALCLTLFAVTAAIAHLRRHYAVAAFLIALALASKEEAVLLPVVLIAAAHLRGERGGLRSAALWSAVLPLAAYLVVRSLTPAFTPNTAPSFYQFTLEPRHLLRNVAEYVDRSATASAFVVLLGAIVYRARPTIGRQERNLIAFCALWWTAMFAITIWLPVRSSLYAVCPSVGPALLAAKILEVMRSRVRGIRRLGLEPLLAVAVLAAIPAYQVRNDPWVEAARVSERTLARIRADAPTLPQQGAIVLRDEPGILSNFRNAFGDLATEALQTAFGRAWTAVITAGGDPTTSADPIERPGVIAEYRLEHGRVVRVPVPGVRPASRG